MGLQRVPAELDALADDFVAALGQTEGALWGAPLFFPLLLLLSPGPPVAMFIHVKPAASAGWGGEVCLCLLCLLCLFFRAQ